MAAASEPVRGAGRGASCFQLLNASIGRTQLTFELGDPPLEAIDVVLPLFTKVPLVVTINGCSD